MHQKGLIICFVTLSMLLLQGCASFYELNYTYQVKLQEENYEGATKYISNHRKFKKQRNVILYHMNMGYLLRQQGAYQESNEHLNKADLLIEDAKREIGHEALALVTNDGLRPYQPEPFEKIMVHYYKSLNYISLNSNESALVEAKRMSILLQRLIDFDPKIEKELHSFIGFTHTIIGLLYEMNADYNNAFIAYRNAINNYSNKSLIPNQLKIDLINSAYKTGFTQEAKQYEKEFGLKVKHGSMNEVILFWENGLSPYKEEFSINFTIIGGQDGYVTFVNEQYDLTLPFFVGKNAQRRQDLLGLRFTRIAFPKYVSRNPIYHQGAAYIGDSTIVLEELLNLDRTAHDWMRIKFVNYASKSLLRLATKKLAELSLNNEHAALGSIANLVNAVTEKADTRNWQTLPSTIAYSRIPVSEETNQLELKLNSDRGQENVSIPVESKKRLSAVSHHSLKVKRLFQ